MTTSTTLSPGDIQDIRRSGWAGILAIFLMFTSLFATVKRLPHLFPDWSNSGTQMTAWFATHRTATIIQCFTAGIALVLFIWLIAGLAAYLEGCHHRTIATRVITPAAVATSLGMQLSNPIWLLAGLSGTPGHPANDTLVHYAVEVAWTSYILLEYYPALLLGAAAIAFLQSRVFPRWAAWSTFAAGVVCLLGTFGVLAGDGWLVPGALASLAPWALLATWMLCVSIALARVSITSPVRSAPSARSAVP